MSDDLMAPRGLLEKSSDADPPREMIGFTAQRSMAPEGAGRGGVSKSHRSRRRGEIDDKIQCFLERPHSALAGSTPAEASRAACGYDGQYQRLAHIPTGATTATRRQSECILAP